MTDDYIPKKWVIYESPLSGRFELWRRRHDGYEVIAVLPGEDAPRLAKLFAGAEDLLAAAEVIKRGLELGIGSSDEEVVTFFEAIEGVKS